MHKGNRDEVVDVGMRICLAFSGGNQWATIRNATLARPGIEVLVERYLKARTGWAYG